MFLSGWERQPFQLKMFENLETLSGTRCWRGLATKGTEKSQIESLKEKADEDFIKHKAPRETLRRQVSTSIVLPSNVMSAHYAVYRLSSSLLIYVAAAIVTILLIIDLSVV